jgi:uncharacterized protein YlxP (DUF503 family)
MVVGVGVVEVFIHESRSLKAKRGVVRSILRRTQNRFNVSIAEVAENDNWQKAVIGFAIAGNDRRYINSKADKIMEFIHNLHLAEVRTSRIDITNYSDMIPEDRGIEDFLDDFQKS